VYVTAWMAADLQTRILSRREFEAIPALTAAAVLTGVAQATITRGALMQGTAPFHAATVFPNVDVIVAGEQREWEGVEVLP